MENNSIITKIIGEHLDEKANQDVKILFFDGISEITSIPKGIESFFPNLIALGFSSCNITQLNSDDLNPFHLLEWFAIEKNSLLERIPPKFFANNLKLKYLWFSQGNLKHVGKNLLDSLSNLSWVVFLNNPCIDKFASSS
jgi:hypothetical protein